VELTGGVGRKLLPLVIALDVVRPSKAAAISSREQQRTNQNHRFERGLFAPRSEP
jgi:hypothetical protein